MPHRSASLTRLLKQPGKGAAEEVRSAFANELAMRDDDALGTLVDQRSHLGPGGSAMEEGHADFDWRVAAALDHPGQPRQRPRPPRPLAFQEGLAERLRIIADDRGAR